jgi:uncharacterized delta-60 repeat protein
VKDQKKKFIGWALAGMTRKAAWLVGGVLLVLGVAAKAQTNFADAEPISGDWGSVTVTNVGVIPDAAAPSIAGQAPKHTVWFQWTASNSGEMTVDTFGSVDAVTRLDDLNTVLGVYTGASLSTLNLMAANANLFPGQNDVNASGQEEYFFGVPMDYSGTTNPPAFDSAWGLEAVEQPFAGPSGLRFNALAGATYYFAVDTYGSTGPGVISLNWALHSSGVFRFATENNDATGLTYSNGTEMLLFQVAATESVAPNPQGGPRATHNYPGAMVTITRVSGSTGRAVISYTTADISPSSYLMGANGFLINGDLAAVAGTDYTPQSGTLTFDDNEMSKTIAIQINNQDMYPNAYGLPNRDFLVLVTNSVLDAAESSDVSPPRLDNTYNEALVRVLDVDTDPEGLSTFDEVYTNELLSTATNIVLGTNIYYSTIATNPVLNFQKAFYQTLRWGSNQTISVWVNRTGTNTGSASVNYAVNTGYPYTKDTFAANDNNQFPLQAGSDYATPDPVNPNILSKVPDFIFPGGYSGTLSWGAGDFTPKAIQFNLYNNGIQAFDDDFQIDLYNLDSAGNPFPVGMVNQCNVTIGNATDILAAPVPPAGAVDEFYNADYGSDLFMATTPPNMAHPGTDGEVFGLAVQPNGQTIVVGSFDTYDQFGMPCLARTTTTGFLDQSFNPGTGPNGGMFGNSVVVSCVALTTNNEVVIGGNFSAYGTASSSGIALVQTTGALDTGFQTGSGFDDQVNAIALQPDGRILVGGNFTSYNGVPRNYLARLNPNGSLDTSFDPGTNLNSAVFALAVETNGLVVAGGDFTGAGGSGGPDYIACFNTNGTLDTAFNPVSGPNADVLAVAVQPDGNIVLGGDFTEVNNQTFNYIARLQSNGSVDPNFNCGIGVDGPVYSLLVNTNPIFSTANSNLITAGFTVYVGGEFTEYNGTHRLGLTRLNDDGTVDTTFLDPAYNQFAGLTRVHYDDPLGTVNALAVQSNGEVLIGGSFSQVGGGDYDARIRPTSDTNAEIGDFRIRAGIRSHANFARLIGGGTPGPGNIGLSYTDYSAGESSGSYEVALVRTNGFLGVATANFSVNAGLAQNGADYVYDGTSPFYYSIWDFRQKHSDAVFGNSAVPSDDYNEVYSGGIQDAPNLAILGGESSTANLTAQFQMANPAGADKFYLGGENIPLGVGLGESAAPFLLINDSHPAGTFGFASSNYVATADTTTTIVLVRTNGTYGTVTINYATVTNGSTAILNSDYRASSGVASFAVNQMTNGQFQVQILNTNYVTPVEKFVNLRLSNLQAPVDGVAVFGLTNSILRIINANFQGFLNFSATNYPISLTAGTVPVTITRTVGSKGTLAVQLTTSNGTATNGVDYSNTVANLSWNSGDVSSRTVLVPLIPNTGFGSNRVFYVNLTNPTLNGTNTPSLLLATTATVTITNNLNSGAFQFSTANYIVDENGGYATVVVNRTGTEADLGFPASVVFATTNGTAFASTNYLATNGVLSFAAGQVSTNFTVSILNDGIVDPPPSQFYFQVNLSNPSAGSLLGTPASTTVDIVDALSYNNPPGSPAGSFNPGSGMNAPVHALALQTNAMILAGGEFTTVNGEPENYLARLNTDGSLDSSGFFNGMAGLNGPVYAVISQTDDSIVAAGAFTAADGVYSSHIVRLLTDGSVDSSFKLGAGANSTVYSLAETFLGGSRYIYAGGAFTSLNQSANPYLVRLTENGALDTGFNTKLGPNGTVYAVAVYPTNSPQAGKLLIGGAFSAVNNFQTPYFARLNVDGSVDTNFDAGLGVDGIVRSIAIQNDGGIVLGGDFLNAFDSNHGTNSIPAAHIARFYDNGFGDSYVDTTNFAAAMSDGPNGSVYSLALQDDNRIVVGGDFTMANGVTRNNITRLNPNGSVDSTINFGFGANAEVYTTLVQPADQLILLGGAFTQYDAQAANYITRIYGGSETGGGQIQFTAANYTVSENAQYAPVTIQRTGGTAGTNSVYFTTADGTALAGTNYLNSSQLVVFPPGEVMETVNVSVTNNGVVSPNLTVDLALTNATVGDQSTATLTILNENSSVSFSAATYSVPKNTASGMAQIGVVRQGSLAGTNTVNFATTSGGTAVIGEDYTPVSETLTFLPGVSNLTVAVAITNNGIFEGNRTIPLQLSDAVGSFVTSPSNAVLTIIDTTQTAGQFEFSATNYTVTNGETGVAQTLITVLRTNGSYGLISVGYYTFNGTAMSGSQYIATNGVLTFGAGVTSQSFFVQTINTALAQAPEYFSLALTNPMGGADFVSPTNATVTILNTNIGIAFVLATNSFIEPFGQNPGSVTLNVVRFNNTSGTNIVFYHTTNDPNVLAVNMAVAGTNFIATNGSITFNPGDSIKPITITTLYDPAVTPDLYFDVSLTLTNATITNTTAQLGVPSTTTVIDHDVNVGISFLTSTNSVFKNAGDVPVTVYVSNTNEEPVSVNYSTGGGSAVGGVDYTTTSGLLTFTNGQVFGTFLVPILVNNSVQSNKTFNVKLSNPTGTGVITPYGTESITILDTNTPYGLSFSTPVVVSGDWGSVTVNNSLGSPEIGDPTIAGNPPTAPVWFQWTAPLNGVVTMDTIGSVQTNGLKMDTVLGVYTGANLNTLNQIAANDDLYPSYPETQINEVAQNIYDTNYYSNPTNFLSGLLAFEPIETDVIQPYGGPSGLRFNAVAGTTYYFAVDSKETEELTSIPIPPYYALVEGGLGNVSLNWAYNPSGVFRFATENVDETGLLGTNGNPLLLYQVSQTEGAGEDVEVGTFNADQYDTTHGTYYSANVQGLLVTVTRVAGSTGRVSVNYTNVDGNPSMLTNGDIPAIAGTDYSPVGGTLIFDDFEMSKTIYVPILYNGLNGLTVVLNGQTVAAQPNKDFTIALSNPQRDPLESSAVSTPRVDSIFGTVLCRILNCNIDPKGPNVSQIFTTNTIAGTTNTTITSRLSVSLIPTNAVFNFTKANYRVQRDEINWFNGYGVSNNIPITLYVNRFGTNTGSVTLNWRIDNDFLDKNSPDDENYLFPLAAGSDYAVPTPADAAAVKGVNSDFAGVGGDSGSITFPGAPSTTFGWSQPIQFYINDNNLTEFNRDVLVSFYGTDSQGNPLQVGMNDQAVVTILFNSVVPPAGSVDQLYNPDFASDLAFPTNALDLGSSLINPGTELYSEVYSVNVLPSNGTTPGNQSLIAGAFTTYNDRNNTYSVNGIARLNYDGTLDTTFNSGSGVNVFPGGEFIRVADVTASGQIIIGGDFTSYNGTQRNSIARLNANGSLDTTFNPGAGVNGTIWAMAMQPNGQVIIGGDFTSYNGQPANYLARVNTDGSLDTTFNAGTNFNAAVYALALETNEMIVAGGAFTSVGGTDGQNRIVRLNTNGVLDATFNTVTGPNGSVRSLAIQPDGSVLAGGEFTLVAGLSENYIVRFTPTGAVDSTFNAGTGTDGTVYDLNDYISTNSDGSTSSVIYVGGSFTTFNGTHRMGFARLYADGSLDTTFLDTAYNQFAGLPRIFYNDPPGTVYSSGVQADGNVMIVGAFQEVGGGQADKNVRNYLEQERGLTGSFADPDLWVAEEGTALEPNSRDGVRNRGNVARLIGGATPGPGNITLASPSYAVNKTQAVEPVTLVRTNGSLGYASANFAVVPGLASSGLDYSNSTVAPLYPIEWEYSGPTRDHFDGLFGPDGEMEDKYGELVKYGFNGPASVNIGIINDTANAGNLSATLQLANPVDVDEFYLGGEDIPVGVALGQSVAPLTLVDNSHQDGVFGFAAPSYTATNSLATIAIARTNSSIGTVELNYQTVTAGSTAVNGVDYLATNGLVLFNSGQINATFPIIVLQNSSSSSTEKDVNMQLYNIQDLSQGDATLGLTNAVLRIINPNFQGYLNLTTNYYVADLTSGTISFTVARTVGSKGTLSVQYATYDETAANKVNYVGSTNTITWNNGDVSAKTVNIPLIYTNVVGSSLQFGVFIFNPTLNSANTASLLGTTTNATMNIINNNNYGSFQFSASQYRVNENGGYATITVTRTGSALGSASVNYATMDGPAVHGLNYVTTNGTLSFVNGQFASSFNVGILNAGVVEPPPASFYFNVGLSLTNSSLGYSLGSPTNAEVQIVGAETYNQPPGSIDTSFNPALVINGSVLALAQQADGQIVAGGVFTSVDGVVLNHVARLNTDGSLDTTFMYNQAGADSYVNAVVSQTDGRVLVGGQFANLDGTSRNGVGRLMTDGTLDTSFAPGSGADSSVFALAETFINGSRELYVGGAFSTFNGVSSPGIVRLFNTGSQDTGFSTGLGANGTVYSIEPYPTNAVFESGDVLVGGNFTNFNNTSAGNLVRLNPNGSVDTNFLGNNLLANGTVRAITIQTDGEILIGGDFTSVDGVTVNHLARLNADGTLDTAFATNLVSGVNGSVDAIVEQPDNKIVVGGQFNQANGLNRNNLTRLLPSGAVDPTIDLGDGANGAVNAVVLQATNDFLVVGGAFTEFEDQPLDYIARLYGGSVVGSGQFSFNAANYQIDEDGGFATITVVRSGGSSGPANNPGGDVYVSFSTTNGTAVAGVNYTGVTNELLDFPLGQSFQTISIPVRDDGVVTPNLVVNLGLGIPDGSPAGLGDQPSAQLTIINDDSGVSFSQANYSVPKDTVTGVANIEIERLGSASGTCSVNFETDTNGTAAIGVDYYPTNVTVTFGAGQSEEFVQVPIINNTIPEGQRTIGMLLTNATGVVLASPTNATLTIIDTVDAPGQLLFATNSYTVMKANTNAILTVVRTNGASGSVSVSYSTVAGTALPGLNYLNSSGTLTLGDGVTSGTIAIPLLDNALVQGTVNFTVNLSAPSGGATLLAPTNAVVNILDHNLGVSFQTATNYTIETSGSAVVFVQRVGATNAAFSVGYNTTPITAVPGTNYTPISGMLTFTPGETLEAISIPVLYDHQVTGDLLFGVNLTNATGGAELVYPTNAIVVIHDADAGFSFTNANASVLKNAGSLTVAVVCSNPSVEPVIVNSNTIPLEVSYYTTNVTAISGVDYGAVSGTLVFTNGVGTNYITVPIINNGTLEGNRTFDMVLANPTAPGQLVAPSTQAVTIVDINSGLEFSSPTYTVLKTGLEATITVLRSDYTNSTVSVNYSATNGTAMANVNFVPVSGTLTFTNGVTQQQFDVQIISSTVVQPDLTVFLQLSGAVGAGLTYPSFATLTIEDLSGSSVVPAGAVLVPGKSQSTNGIIYPGQTNTLDFAFRADSGTNVANLVATLLAENGVTPTAAPETQDYGPLIVGGHSVAEPFTFLATGTNGQAIQATFRLQNVTTTGNPPTTNNLGTNSFTFTLGTWQDTFSNSAPIIMSAFQEASPYPSIINVSGLAGVILKTTVTFTNLTHTSPDAIEALVAAPDQQNTLLMNNVGGGNSIKNVTLTFDDAATNSLPGPTSSTPIVTSTNKPTAFPTINSLP